MLMKTAEAVSLSIEQNVTQDASNDQDVPAAGNDQGV